MGTLCYGPSNYSLIDGVKEDDNMYGYIMLWSISHVMMAHVIGNAPVDFVITRRRQKGYPVFYFYLTQYNIYETTIELIYHLIHRYPQIQYRW